jgi:uncharacterized coiled-coil DUF342 family protein
VREPVPAPHLVAFDRSIDDIVAERDRIDQRINEWYEERDRLRAKANGVDLKRSQMTALEKSKYIRAHGGEAYLSLPWS